MMSAIRAAVLYTGMDMERVLDLPCDVFMLCTKNWTIEKLRETQEGREYLEDIERYKITKPDLGSLHELQEQMR